MLFSLKMQIEGTAKETLFTKKKLKLNGKLKDE